MFNNYRDDTMQSRMGRTTAGESIRPMTAIGGAGFQSQSTSKCFSLVILVSFDIWDLVIGICTAIEFILHHHICQQFIIKNV